MCSDLSMAVPLCDNPLSPEDLLPNAPPPSPVLPDRRFELDKLPNIVANARLQLESAIFNQSIPSINVSSQSADSGDEINHAFLCSEQSSRSGDLESNFEDEDCMEVTESHQFQRGEMVSPPFSTPITPSLAITSGPYLPAKQVTQKNSHLPHQMAHSWQPGHYTSPREHKPLSQSCSFGSTAEEKSRRRSFSKRRHGDRYSECGPTDLCHNYDVMDFEVNEVKKSCQELVAVTSRIASPLVSGTAQNGMQTWNSSPGNSTHSCLLQPPTQNSPGQHRFSEPFAPSTVPDPSLSRSL